MGHYLSHWSPHLTSPLLYIMNCQWQWTCACVFERENSRRKEMKAAWRFLNLLMVVILMGRGEGQLAANFYGSSCPNVESIVMQAVSTKFSQTFTTIPATLRLFFHDCFVEVNHFCQLNKLERGRESQMDCFGTQFCFCRDVMHRCLFRHRMGMQKRILKTIFH